MVASTDSNSRCLESLSGCLTDVIDGTPQMVLKLRLQECLSKLRAPHHSARLGRWSLAARPKVAGDWWSARKSP